MGKGSRSSAGTLTYADAGVDIDAGERVAALIKPLAASTRRPEVVGGVGFFGGLFQLGGYANPVLVSSTDSVGTKVLLAIQMGRFDTIGVDLVNHCVNDIFVGGAEPLFFLDYIGLGKLDPEQVERLVMGVASACRDNNCALVGGETAELPDLYKRGDFDLVGFIVGAVERDRVIDGSAIQRGDAILGLPSSGLHTNGYTLARRALGTDDDPSTARRAPRCPRRDAGRGAPRTAPLLHEAVAARAGVDPRHGAHNRRRLARQRSARPSRRTRRAVRPLGVGGPRDLPYDSTGGRRSRRRDVARLQHGDRHGGLHRAGTRGRGPRTGPGGFPHR